MPTLYPHAVSASLKPIPGPGFLQNLVLSGIPSYFVIVVVFALGEKDGNTVGGQIKMGPMMRGEKTVITFENQVDGEIKVPWSSTLFCPGLSFSHLLKRMMRIRKCCQIDCRYWTPS